MAPPKIKGPIALANNGKEYPAMDLVRHDPGMAATISKLIPSRDGARYDNHGNRAPEPPNVYQMRQISETTARNISDATTVMQILPDMELAAQILVSSILSPKDMMTTELTYMAPEGSLPPNVASAMINCVRQHFEQRYKIKPLLTKMVREPLFETGSYAVAVIPENAIDDVINGGGPISLESLKTEVNGDGSFKARGLLGPAVKKTPTLHSTRHSKGMSLEAFDEYRVDTNHDTLVRFKTDEDLKNIPEFDSYISVTDNYSALKMPQVTAKIREQRIMSAVGNPAFESMHKLNDRELTNLMYKNRQFTYTPIASLKTQEQLARRTVGEPLILRLPSESVIPVYVPGAEDEHIGYFVLIDGDGNPIKRANDVDYYSQLSARMNSQGSFPSAMLQKLKQNIDGYNCADNQHLDYSSRVFGSMVEQDLLARLRNGVYTNGVQLASRPEIYRVMLARALAKQHTQLLFLPVQLMTYIAFRYNRDGIGVSMLDDMKVLNSLRSMLLFANVMAGIKNSIGRTEVKLKLDERDPDPQKTIERLMHEILRTRQQAFPVGTNSPMDITDYLSRASMEFGFEGHPGIPDVQVEFGEKNTNFVKPDSDLEDSLRKRAIMAFGMSPETVDATFQAEFATSVVTNNILLSKRVMQVQDQFTPQLTDHMRKVVMSSENLIRDLRHILTQEQDKLIKRVQAAEKVDGVTPDGKTEPPEIPPELLVSQKLAEFVMNFTVELPKPNSVTLENQLTALKAYKEALDEVLEAYISADFLNSDTMGDMSEHIESLKAVVKAYYVRKWLAENGVMPELSDLVSLDEENKPIVNIYDEMTANFGALTKSMGYWLEGIQVVKRAANKVKEQIDNTDNTETDNAAAPGASSEPSGGGFDNDPYGGGGDDLFGGENDAALDSIEEEPGGDKEPGTATETPENPETSSTETPEQSTNAEPDAQ